MNARIQIVAIKELKGIGKQSQKPFEMTVCDCVILGDQAGIGELVLPKDHEKVTLGVYDAEFGIMVDNQTKRISGQLKKLTRVAGAAAVGPAQRTA